MAAQTLREYMMYLGWKLDESSKKRFDDGIGDTAKKVATLAAGVEAAALALQGLAIKASQSLATVYFMSQRTGASVRSIDAFTFAVEMLGGTAQGAKSAINGLAQNVLNNPNFGLFIRANFGSETMQQIRRGDYDRAFARIGDRFRQLNEHGRRYVATNFAGYLGLDFETTNALLQGVGPLVEEHRKRMQRLGVDEDSAAKAGVRLQQAQLRLKDTWQAIKYNIEPKLLDMVSTQLERLAVWFNKNHEEVERWIDGFSKGLMKVATVIVDVVVPALVWIHDRLVELDKATGGWSTAILGVLVALRLLGMGPEALAVAGLALAITGLVRDYETWQKTGKSLIPWGEWSQQIEDAKKGVSELATTIREKLIGLAPLLKQEFKDAFTLLLDFVNLTLAVANRDRAKTLEYAKKVAGDVVPLAADTGAVALASGAVGVMAPPGTEAAGEAAAAAYDKLSTMWAGFAKKTGFHSVGADEARKHQYLNELEKQHGLPRDLLYNQWGAESAWGNELGYGVKGQKAFGDFQFTPDTAAEYHIPKYGASFEQQAGAAAAKMQHLIGYYHRDLISAVAAYNLGDGKLADRGGIENIPEETKGYLGKVVTRGMVAEAAAGPGSVTNNTTFNVTGPDPHANAAAIKSILNDRDADTQRYQRRGMQ